MSLAKHDGVLVALFTTLVLGGMGSGAPAEAGSPEAPEAAVDSMKDGAQSPVSKDSSTIAGEPIDYLSTPSPEISSMSMSIPPGSTTQWMIHPVPLYIYVLEGTLTVEFADGSHQDFEAGRAFLQARTKWHHGRNKGTAPVRFLAVSFGAKGVPTVLHPPGGEESHPGSSSAGVEP